MTWAADGPPWAAYGPRNPSEGGISQHPVSETVNRAVGETAGQRPFGAEQKGRPQQDSNLRSRLRRRRTASFEFALLPAWTRSLISPAAKTIPRIFRIMDTSAVTARTLQGMARVRSGQAPAWPFVF